MISCIARVRRFLLSEEGPTAVEYAVLISLVAVTLIGAVNALTGSISGTFMTVSSTISPS